MTSSFFSFFPLPFTLCFLRTKYTFFRLYHDTVRGRDRWFRNSLEFGAGEHTGEDEIEAVELDDLENDGITEEETKRAEVDAAPCNPKLPKHMATWADSNRTENFVRFQGPLAERSDGFSRKCAILFRTSQSAAARFRRSFRISVCKTSLLISVNGKFRNGFCTTKKLRPFSYKQKKPFLQLSARVKFSDSLKKT